MSLTSRVGTIKGGTHHSVHQKEYKGNDFKPGPQSSGSQPGPAVRKELVQCEKREATQRCGVAFLEDVQEEREQEDVEEELFFPQTVSRRRKAQVHRLPKERKRKSKQRRRINSTIAARTWHRVIQVTFDGARTSSFTRAANQRVVCSVVVSGHGLPDARKHMVAIFVVLHR